MQFLAEKWFGYWPSHPDGNGWFETWLTCTDLDISCNSYFWYVTSHPHPNGGRVRKQVYLCRSVSFHAIPSKKYFGTLLPNPMWWMARNMILLCRSVHLMQFLTFWGNLLPALMGVHCWNHDFPVQMCTFHAIPSIKYFWILYPTTSTP